MRTLLLLLCLCLPALAAAAPAPEACKGTPPAREALLRAVEALLQRSAAQPFERVVAEEAGALPALAAMPQLALKSAWPAGRVAIEMQWEVCGKVQKKIAWFKARALRQGWVYGESAAADTALAAAKPQAQLVDVALWRLGADELAAAPAGEFLARAVRAGTPVRRADLKPAPLVKRNERVTVLVNGHGLQLKAGATALQFGADGEWIAVLVDGAAKSMRARVVAQGVVHVEI